MQREILEGKLRIAERKKYDIELVMASALTMIVIKADTYEKDYTRLDTAMILNNSQTLHQKMAELVEVNKEIAVLRKELYG